MENRSRTIFKTLSWRLLATSTTLILVYIFTQNLVISTSISIVEIVVKTIVYYLHERIWDKINFGRKNSNPINLIPSSYNSYPVTEKIGESG